MALKQFWATGPGAARNDTRSPTITNPLTVALRIRGARPLGSAAGRAPSGPIASERLSLAPDGGYRCLEGATSCKGSQGLTALGDGMAAARRIICVGHAALDRIYRIE